MGFTSAPFKKNKIKKGVSILFSDFMSVPISLTLLFVKFWIPMLLKKIAFSFNLLNLTLSSSVLMYCSSHYHWCITQVERSLWFSLTR